MGKRIADSGTLMEEEIRDELLCLVEAQTNAGYSGIASVPEKFKPVQERSDCQLAAPELQTKYGVRISNLESNPNKNDLPDCIGTMDGKRVGIEVTRLTLSNKELRQYRDCLTANIESFCATQAETNEARVIEIRASLAAKPLRLAKVLQHFSPQERFFIFPPAPEWPFQVFQERLQAIVLRKEEKARQHAEAGKLDKFAALLLLVRTDEKSLHAGRVEEYLQRLSISGLRYFGVAYLKLLYHPGDAGHGRHPVYKIPVS